MNAIFKRDGIISYGFGSGSAQRGKIIKITFKELAQIIDTIAIPDIQNDLQEDKILEMITAYKTNPSHFITKCLIVIVEFTIGDSKEYYLIDGQHRANMCVRLHALGHNEVLLCALISVASRAEFNLMFEELNKDSIKCRYPRLSIFEKEQYEIFKKALHFKCNGIAPKSSSDQNRLYTISEVVVLLQKLCIDINELFIKEAEFYDKVSYLELSNNSTTCKFSITEIKSIKAGSCILIKRNNFIEWIMNPQKGIVPKHFFNNRKKISASLKKTVWQKYFETSLEGQCQFHGCTNRLMLDVINSWHCGHIISVHNGGTNDINNIKPLCPSCNYAMSSNNWQ
jgi:hypothetical protein